LTTEQTNINCATIIVKQLDNAQSRVVEAMTSLARLIFFDEPGTGASDPVTPGALPTLEQWADILAAAVL
jgi:hypothetical protein